MSAGQLPFSELDGAAGRGRSASARRADRRDERTNPRSRGKGTSAGAIEADALLDGLTEAQLAAVTASGGPVVVIAGAGSGKTRVLARRIAWRCLRGETDPLRVMAVTFTRKAAGELRSRLATSGIRDPIAAGTFHSFALLQLRRRWADRGIAPPSLVQSRYRLLSAALPDRSTSSRKRVDMAAVAAEIDWARARVVAPQDYEAAAAMAGRQSPLPSGHIEEMMVNYQAAKQKKRMVDFDDLLTLALRDVRNDPRYAEAVRWSFQHLYVDEFQDVNPLQFELLRAWQGDRNDLFVVGDPNQAIYGWNGADPNLLSNFHRRDRRAQVVVLRDNYRSSPQILAVASTLAQDNPLIAHHHDGEIPVVSCYPDDAAEAAGIVEQIRNARALTRRWSDQAVLARTNAQLPQIEVALKEAGIPARIRASSSPLATNEVKTELAAFDRGGIDIGTAITDLFERSEVDDGLPRIEIERRQNLAALARLGDEYMSSDPHPSSQKFVAWVGTLQADDVASGGDVVDLLTFHSAKGLEWPVVHIAGVEEGFVPIAYATTGAQIDEERRLLYVAVTRAETQLNLSWAAERTFTNKPVKRQPSHHLGAIEDALKRLTVNPRTKANWRRALAESRSAIDATNPPSPPPASGRRGSRHTTRATPDLHQALEQWRRRKARSANVSPHAVLSDDLLASIVQRQPTNRAQLAATPGMTPVRLNRYGADLLQIITQTTDRATTENRRYRR